MAAFLVKYVAVLICTNWYLGPLRSLGIKFKVNPFCGFGEEDFLKFSSKFWKNDNKIGKLGHSDLVFKKLLEPL